MDDLHGSAPPCLCLLMHTCLISTNTDNALGHYTLNAQRGYTRITPYVSHFMIYDLRYEQNQSEVFFVNVTCTFLP